jgi:hypothetical protein
MYRAFVISSVLCLSAAGSAMGKPPCQLWGGQAQSDWARTEEAVVITDMTKCQPASALAPRLKKGHWRIIPYEMTTIPIRDPDGPPFELGNNYAGNVVYAAPEAEAPELTLRLGVTGWHAIFVGLFGSDMANSTLFKVDSDPAPVTRSTSNRDYYGNSTEVFLKAVELKPDSVLHIGQRSSGHASGAAVTHVKLIPLTQDEIDAIHTRRSDKSRRIHSTGSDGFSFIYAIQPTTEEDVRTEIEQFRNTDYGTFLLESFGADRTSYPSKVGHMPGQDQDLFTAPGYGYYAKAIGELARKNINPVKVLIDAAHEMGMPIHVGIRPAGWSHPTPFSDFWDTPFYLDNPQWRCFERDGTEITRMSWAYPEVRKHMIDLLVENMTFGADGAHVMFGRGYPVVLYEQPALDAYQKRFGGDPRKVPEPNPKMVEVWSDYVTLFFKELRAALDKYSADMGSDKRLKISVLVLPGLNNNLQFGVDVARLVNEGLLDQVYTEDGFGTTQPVKDYFQDVKEYMEICKPKGVRFHPSLPYGKTSKEYLELAIATLEMGVDGIYRHHQGGDHSWGSTIEEMRYRLENDASGAPPQKSYYFHKLGDHIRDTRYGSWWGG